MSVIYTPNYTNRNSSSINSRQQLDTNKAAAAAAAKLLNDSVLIKQKAAKLEREIKHCFSELFIWPSVMMAENYRAIYASADEARVEATRRKKAKKIYEARREAQIKAVEALSESVPLTEFEQAVLQKTRPQPQSIPAEDTCSDEERPAVLYTEGEREAIALWQKRQLPELIINPYTRPQTIAVRTSANTLYPLHSDFINPIDIQVGYNRILSHYEKFVMAYSYGLGFSVKELAGKDFLNKSPLWVQEKLYSALVKLTWWLSLPEDVRQKPRPNRIMTGPERE